MNGQPWTAIGWIVLAIVGMAAVAAPFFIVWAVRDYHRGRRRIDALRRDVDAKFRDVPGRYKR